MQNEQSENNGLRSRLSESIEKNRDQYKRFNFWQDAWYRFSKRRLSLISLAVICLIVIITIAGPYIYQGSFSNVDFGNKFLDPNSVYPFGTNELGQDMLARFLFGGRISLSVGLFAMIVSILVGTVVGSISGLFGGLIDTLLMRITDLFLSLPVLPLLLVVIYLFRDPMRRVAGPELGIFILVILVIGLLQWMSVARLVRSYVLSIRETEFVLAARSMGASPWRLLHFHVLPNVVSPIIVAATLSVGTAITMESTLSFLGLGFPPDTPTWGRMLFEARTYLGIEPRIAFIPAVGIFITILSINAVGDGLREALDPRMRFN